MINNKKLKLLKTLGIILIVVACLLWLSLLFVHLLPLSRLQKAATYTSIIVVAEILFWPGSALLGTQWAMKIRKIINPIHWFSKKKSD